MANGRKVTSFRDIGKLGVGEVVKEAEEKRATRVEDAASAVLAAVGASDLDALFNFRPNDFVKANKQSAEDVLEALDRADELQERISIAKDTLRKVRETNRKKGILVDTEETKKLVAMIDAGDKALESVDPAALQLHKFRKNHTAVEALAKKGAEIHKALKKGEAVPDAEIDALFDGYYKYFHVFRKERKIVEVPAYQLQKWSGERKSFSESAFAAKSDDGEKKFWFWGKARDDQGMAIAQALKGLYIVCERINYFLKKQEEAESAPKSVPAAETPPEKSTSE